MSPFLFSGLLMLCFPSLAFLLLSVQKHGWWDVIKFSAIVFGSAAWFVIAISLIGKGILD